MTISFFEAVSVPAVITNTAMDNYENYWAGIQGGAVDPLLTSADNRMKSLKLLATPVVGTLADLEREHYRKTLGANAAFFSLGDLRLFVVNSMALPPVIPFVPGK